MHAVLGGTPAYGREFVDGDLPRDLADFDDWVVRAVLDPGRPLFREGAALLAELEVRERALYAGILAAVSEGRTTRGAIASHVGRPSTDLSHALNVLETGGWLRREENALPSQRPRYRLDEPFLGFHGAVMRPSTPALERGYGTQVWAAAQQTFAAQILGPNVEEMAREWTISYASAETLGGMPQRVASSVVADPQRRTQNEVDVVAVHSDGEHPVVLAIGEVKAARTMNGRDLERLIRIRELLRSHRDVDASDT